MIKCAQVMENGIENKCGKQICCYECDDKCIDACKDDFNNCSYKKDVSDTTDGVETSPSVKAFVEKYDETIAKIRNFMIEKDKIVKEEKILKEKLKTAMEEFNIKSFQNESIKITYVAPTSYPTIDTERIKKELPEVYSKYSKTTSKSAFVKVETK